MAPLRMNVRTGTVTEMGKAWPYDVFDGDWVIDSQGQVRAGLQRKDGETTLLVADGAGKWQPPAQFPAYAGGPNAPSWMASVPTDRPTSTQGPRAREAREALYRFDLATGRPTRSPS